MKKLSPLVLSLMCSSAMAGSYVDSGTDAMVKDNKDADHHFYVDVGVNGYYFDQPGVELPVSLGYADPYGAPATPWPTTEGDSSDDSATNVMPTLTLGYEFLAPNEKLKALFGDQNAIELRAAYFHSSTNTTDVYPEDYYVNNWFITGSSKPFSDALPYILSETDWDFDNTYYSLGVYYTGKKVVSDSLVNSPYVGINFSYLKQDSDYTAYMTEYNGTPSNSVGSNHLDSYYTGLEFGDKLAYLFKRNYAVYGKAGVGVYLLHTSLEASQLPSTDPYVTPLYGTTYTVTTDDDTITFKLTAETGLSYYFSGNQNPMSMSVTLLTGIEYWNDVAYADNPNAPNESVTIGYDNSVNPYAGLQLHVPIA